jgi:hypothetical protein
MEVNIMLAKRVDRAPLMEYHAQDPKKTVVKQEFITVEQYRHTTDNLFHERVTITDPKDITLMIADINQVDGYHPELTISDRNWKDKPGTLIPQFDKEGNFIVSNCGVKIDQTKLDPEDGFKTIKVNPAIVFSGVLQGDEIQSIGQINKAIKALLPKGIEKVMVTRTSSNCATIYVDHSHNTYDSGDESHKCTILSMLDGKLKKQTCDM